MSEDTSALASFGGTARLFPLPNLVLFPDVVQPLHIFEPRYRQMTAEALDADRLIALVLLKPGWEAQSGDQPAIHPVACLGRIITEQRLDDGRFNILLRGLCRARIVEELATGQLFRTARVDLLHDGGPPPADRDRHLRRELDRLVPAWLKDQGPVLEHFQQLLKSDQPLGVLTNIIAFALPFDGEVKQELLEILDVEKRASLLVRHLEEKQPAAPAPGPIKKYPPNFSAN